MLAMLLRKLALTLLLTLLGLAALEQFDPDPPPLLVDAGVVKADLQACVMIHNEPLLRSPKSQHDYRPGVPFNDKGDT